MIKRITKILLVALLVAMLTAPFQAQASPENAPEYGRRQYLRTGFILVSSSKYGGVAGKGASLAVQFRSDRHNDVYFVFPAVSGKLYVRQASYYLLSRSGAYSGNANLSLEVYDFNGSLQRTLSVTKVNLQTTPTQTWSTISLPESIDDCQLQPGEVPAFHLALDDGVGGNLDVRSIFEVATEPSTLTFLKFFFPLVVRK